jgi:hypothetical protein
VCRKATGTYLGRSAPVADNAYSVVASDFDGDGRADVLTQEELGGSNSTKFRVHFFDRDGVLAQTFVAGRSVISLGVGQVSDDQRSDVVFTDGRIGMLLGQADRALISETIPSYYLPYAKIRVAGPVYPGAIHGSSALLILSESGDETRFLRPNETTLKLTPLAAIPGTHIDDLAGDLVTAEVFPNDRDDPCLDAVVALRGATEIRVYSLCKRDENDQPAWRDDAGEVRVPLEPPSPITSGPLLEDVDGDGHLDLIVGTQQHAYVAYGDGNSLSIARPWIARVSDLGPDANTLPIDMPLALGDFTGDGPADLVYPSLFLVSSRSAEGEISYTAAATRFGGRWTSARVADFNGNGKLDVVAASDSRLDIDFYNGTGGRPVNPYVIPTDRPVRQLAVGDFDGDLIDDLAYLQVAPPAESSEVKVAFGNVAGPPMAAVTAARARDVMQLGALDYDGNDGAAELFLAYLQPDAAGTPGSAFAWFTGFDRKLVCLVELTSFSTNGSLESMTALGLTLGSFSRPGSHDALVLASKLESNDVAMWLVSDLRSRTASPQFLGWPFDADLRTLRGVPAEPTVPNFEIELDVLTAAGDLDGDGIDEFALAAPSADGQHCRVAIAHVRATADAFELESSPVVSLDARCTRFGRLAIEDLDGDSAPDLALLTGSPDEARSLLALWNDGSGGFSADAVASLARASDSPSAFALYRPTQGEKLRIAYVTSERLRVLEPKRRARTFDDAPVVLDVELERATGVATGDVDGDGISDLIVAESGNVAVFRAELEP